MPLIVKERMFATLPPTEGPPVAAASARWPSLLHALRGTDTRTKRRAAYCGRTVTTGFRKADPEERVDDRYVTFREALVGRGLQQMGASRVTPRVGSTCPTCDQLAPLLGMGG